MKKCTECPPGLHGATRSTKLKDSPPFFPWIPSWYLHQLHQEAAHGHKQGLRLDCVKLDNKWGAGDPLPGGAETIGGLFSLLLFLGAPRMFSHGLQMTPSKWIPNVYSEPQSHPSLCDSLLPSLSCPWEKLQPQLRLQRLERLAIVYLPLGRMQSLWSYSVVSDCCMSQDSLWILPLPSSQIYFAAPLHPRQNLLKCHRRMVL